MLTNDEISKIIANKIKDSQRTTAFYLERLNMSPAIFSLALTGKRKWTVSEFVSLCKILNLKIEDFMTQ